MHRLLGTLIASSALFAGAESLGNATDHPPSARHQLMVCMTKAMSASRTISYNQASKLCKQQLHPPAMASAVASKPADGWGR
ncbi:MAG: hypothetical protein ABSH33_08915 [Steroidobacteraceae bacterium]